MLQLLSQEFLEKGYLFFDDWKVGATSQADVF